MLAQGLPESQVVNLWNTLLESGADLVTDAGEPFSLTSPGRLNDSRGADICGAVLLSSHGKRCGDIEFHVLAGDWYRHGHHRDPAYRKVILHVVLSNDRSPILNPVDEIPTISLYRYLNESVQQSLKLGDPVKAFPFPGCQASGWDPGKTVAFLEAAGEARFQEKVVGFLQLLQFREGGQVLYAGIMEALGYTKNKVPFTELADRVPLDSLESIVRRQGSPAAGMTEIQASLIGTAGLLPSQRRPPGVIQEYSAGENGCCEELSGHGVNKATPSPLLNSTARGGLIKEIFARSDVRKDASVYVSDDYTTLVEQAWQSGTSSNIMSLQSWDLYKVRPANSPVRRLAAMSYLLMGCGRAGLFDTLMGKFEGTPSGQGRLLVDGMQVASDGYWLDHYEFGLPSPVPVSGLIGSDRASEIIVNVLLPFMYALGSIKTDTKMMDKSRDLYRTLPAGEGNSIERHMIGRLGLHKGSTGTAVRRQGLIHVYKTFCVQGRCGECGLKLTQTLKSQSQR
jgi:hypothetical protein